MPESSDAKPQSQRFIDAAKDLGADVDEETLRRTLGKLAKAKPADTTHKRPKKGESPS